MIVFSIIVGFILGSLPFSHWVAISSGIDLKKHASGNVGATNVYRALGWKKGLLALLLDAAKGVVPLAIIALLAPQAGKLDYVLAGAAAIIGHIFTPWLNFKGGKGVATAAGVMIALVPLELLIALVICGLVIKITRYMALGSLIAGLAMILNHVFIFNSQAFSASELPITVFLIGANVVIIITHFKNIKRLLSGTENKLKI